MRFSFTITCLAAVVIAVHTTNPAELNYNSNNRHQQQNHILEPLNVASDRENIAYLIPRLAAKYQANGEWSDVTDPRLYMLSEMANEPYDDQVIDVGENIRAKRQNFDTIFSSQMRYIPPKRGALSINAPMHSLQELYKQNRLKQQLQKNRNFLNGIY